MLLRASGVSTAASRPASGPASPGLLSHWRVSAAQAARLAAGVQVSSRASISGRRTRLFAAAVATGMFWRSRAARSGSS